MKSLVTAGIALCLVVQSLGAQRIDTKTIELRHLKPAEAVKLLKPYVELPDGGVFDVGENLSIITLRDAPNNIARMERVLAKYDHSPATVRLVFQLIEADTGPRVSSTANFQAPVSIDLDSTLRSVLKFPSYRLLAQGVASVGEFSDVYQQLPTRDSQWVYSLTARVGAIRIGEVAAAESGRSGPTGGGSSGARTAVASTVHLSVMLDRRNSRAAIATPSEVGREYIIETGLDVPLGHMVVLGTAATRSNGAALILTVKPELVPEGH